MAQSPSPFIGNLPILIATCTLSHATSPNRDTQWSALLYGSRKNIPSTETQILLETKRVTPTRPSYPILRERVLRQKIREFFKNFNIKVAHKPIRTISHILKKPRDKIKEATKGVV